MCNGGIAAPKSVVSEADTKMQAEGGKKVRNACLHRAVLQPWRCKILPTC